jgi:protein-disulfide isomerase
MTLSIKPLLGDSALNRFTLSLMLAALALPVTFHATAAKAEMTADQKKEVEELVKQYILAHGEVLMQSVTDYQAKQEEATNKEAGTKAKELLATLKTENSKAYAGNADGKITIVEFFDYNCGYCKKAFEEIQKVLKDDKDVKIVFYDMPILGPDSVESAKWSLAAKKQDKYFAFHTALMNHQGGKDAETLKKLAGDAGLDVAKLEKDKSSPDIEAEIKQHLQTAQGLGIQGTPGFLINEKIFRGYIPEDVIQKTIADERAKK